jgi:hypothetical protein
MNDARISFRVSRKLASEFDAAAQLDGLSPSEAGRVATTAYVETVLLRNDERPAEADRRSRFVEHVKGSDRGP